jgi:predicted metallopeptidase
MQTLGKGQKFIKSPKNQVNWIPAPDVKVRVKDLLEKLENTSFDASRIFCFRSENTNTRAIARIWGLSRIWQQALDVKPAYSLEVISEKFDRMGKRQQDEVLLHELAHIPNNFSGALVPHIRRGKRNFYTKVKGMIKLSL